MTKLGGGRWRDVYVDHSNLYSSPDIAWWNQTEWWYWHNCEYA